MTARPAGQTGPGPAAALPNNPEIKVAGRSNLYIGNISGNPTLYYFGEQMDDTPIVERDFYNDVPGDSHGGPQGPPIDRQVIGKTVQVSFTLSVWSRSVREWLSQHNGAYSTLGAIEDWEIGRILFDLYKYRLVVVPIVTTMQPEFTFNFPTALLSSPVEAGQGSKFSALRFTVEAHRGPPAAAVGVRGVIWNRDTTGVSGAQAAAMQAKRVAAATRLAELSAGAGELGGVAPPAV